MFYNLVFLTLGNVVSGVGMMAGAYWYVTRSETRSREPAPNAAGRPGGTVSEADH